ncbi:MAG: FAD-dependent oxidoreductase [Clostridia bacterium]|nr:FAD-dependent oxidoreductase [Clostridia bacterium]
MSELNVKYLILGAGISGLSFANFVDSEDYLVVEKDSRPGGYCKTTIRGDYVWDYAGHFFHFKTEEMKKFFEEKMKDCELVTQQKNTKIYYKDNLINYPFQTNIHQLDKEEFIDCLYDLFNKVEKDNYDNFLDMLYGKFGKSIVEKFLKPYNEKLYACDLNKLDKDAMGRFFPYADLKQIIDNMKKNENNSYNNQFLYPRKGAGAFMDKLYESLNPEKVKLNTCINKIDVGNKTAYTDKGDVIKYEYLINTSPLNQFLGLMGRTEDVELLNKLSYNKVLVFNLGFEKKSDFDEHWIYLPEKQYNYYRVGFYNNILSDEKLSMYIEIGFSKDAEIDVDKELQLTLENLEKNGITKDNKLVDHETIIMDPAYVHIEKETSEDIKNYMRNIANEQIYSIGRYGAWTYCSMEDAMISAKELAAKLR